MHCICDAANLGLQVLHTSIAQAYYDNSGWQPKHDYDGLTSTSESNNTEDHNRMGDQSDSEVQDLSQNVEENLPAVNKASAPGNAAATRTEGQKEVIEQFEPGIYVTVYLLSNRTKIFKRVRFSKKRFSEQQAEAWWKENKDRLLKRYVPQRQSSEPTEAVADQPSPDEAKEDTEMS